MFPPMSQSAELLLSGRGVPPFDVRRGGSGIKGSRPIAPAQRFGDAALRRNGQGNRQPSGCQVEGGFG